MNISVLFWLLFFLTCGIWFCAILFFWYGHTLIRQQQKNFNQMLPYLKKIKAEQESLKTLTVSDDMPLSKLKDVSLPENVRIHFSHKKRKE